MIKEEVSMAKGSVRVYHVLARLDSLNIVILFYLYEVS
jgi:hypothetical protein